MLSIIQIPQESSVTLTASQYESLCVVQQLKRSFSPGNRLGALIALCIGSFVPTASFEIVHFETLSNRWMWILVAGALLFSATSVFGLAQAAFHSGVKGAGFCVLVEGVMVLSHCHWLSVAALALLITINVASASCALQVQPDSVTSDSGMQSLGRTLHGHDDTDSARSKHPSRNNHNASQPKRRMKCQKHTCQYQT